MTMLSDEELAGELEAAETEWGLSGRHAEVAPLFELIRGLIAQRDRARDIAVSLEQELAEVQRDPMLYATGVSWTDGPQPWSEMEPDDGADQVIAEFDAVAKAALRDTTTITAWNATPAVHPVGDES